MKRSLHVIKPGQQRLTLCGRVVGTPGGLYYPGVESQHVWWFKEHQFLETVWPRVCLACRRAYEKRVECCCGDRSCACGGRCKEPASILVIRMNELDAPAVPMCAGCAEPHLASGVWGHWQGLKKNSDGLLHSSLFTSSIHPTPTTGTTKNLSHKDN